MSDMAILRQQAAQARAGAAGSTSMAVPQDRGQVGSPARLDSDSPEIRYPSQLRAKTVQRDDGMDWYQVEGYASAFEQGYEMYDAYGPYTEIVSAGAADQTLAAAPEVVFRFNHAGTPMASTRNGRLELWADEQGLGQRAWLNPKRTDVQDLMRAIEDSDVREQSFMFRITSGQWSPDYTEYRINTFDLERGDVGPVTYGASPHTSIAARSGEFLNLIPSLSPLMAREAFARLSERTDLTVAQPVPQMPARVLPTAPAAPEKSGRSISMIRTKLLVELGED